MAEKYYVTDTDLSDRFPLYTRANVGEVFPDPVTPLTSTTTLWFAELGWRDAWERMGAFDQGEFPADQFCQLGVVGGYCYLNASMIRIFGERAPGLSWRDMDEQFFGAMPGVPPYEAMDGDEDLAKTEAIGETFAWVLAQTSLDQLDELTEDRRSTKELRDTRPDLSAMSNEELFADFVRFSEVDHRLLFSHHLFATYMATVPVGIIAGVAWAVERPDLLMPIIAGIGEVDSAAPSFALWDMGRAVAASTELTAAFDAGAATVLATLGESDSPEAVAFVKDFEDFLYEFGSRGPNEWECRSPTWDTKPSLALGAIERMRMAAEDQAPAVLHAARVEERAAASAELLAMVEGDAETHGTLSAAIASTAAWLPGRERTKTNNIRLIHEMRVRMREIGRRMVDLGGFDEIEDFGFVTQDEYPGLFEAPTSLLETVRERRREYEGWLEKEPEFVFSKPPADPATWRRRDSTDSESVATGDALQGIPGCSGVVEGRARVVLDSNDPTALEPGDILVAPITDPSWTPLFVPAAGVVVDVGAPLSHAIIVSRELGIPCVVSVTDGTRRIPDGATIRVDGDTGTVTIL